MKQDANSTTKDCDENASKRDIFIVTHNYPFAYNGGEAPFLVPELPYLERQFRKITFVPINPVGSRLDDGKYEVDLALSRALASKNPLKAFDGCLRNPHMGEELRLSARLGPRYLRRILRIGSQIIAARDWAEELLRQRPAGDYPVFYSFWMTPAIYGVASATASSPAISICRAHGGDVYEDRRPFRRFEFRKGFAGCLDYVFPTSLAAYRHLTAAFPELEPRSAVSHLGTEEPGRANSPSPDGVFRIVSCSSVIDLKRVDGIFEAINGAAASRPGLDIEWTHIGDGPGLAKLRELIAARQLENLVVHTPGSFPHRDVFRYYSDEPVDLFVNYSTTEGLPVSIQEAMSFGIPVMAVDVGGIAEIVTDETGYLLPAATTPSGLAEAMLGAAENSVARAEKRLGARKRWEKEFSAERNYVEFCDKLLASASAKDVG